MGYWIPHDEDTGMAMWLHDSVMQKCSACGAPMLNYYNDDIRCTKRRCSNEDCCGMKAARANFMFKLLNIKDIGYKTCLQYTADMEGISHVALLKEYPRQKMPLHVFLRIHCFEGVDSVWEDICVAGNMYSLEDLFDNYYGDYRQLLEENKDLLYDNLQYVDLVERPENHVDTPLLYYNIMVTGTPNGFASKEHFFEELNNAMLGKIVLLHQKTPRQTGVDYLIMEPGSKTKTKLNAALQGGVPVVSSQEFIQIMIDKLNELNSEED